MVKNRIRFHDERAREREREREEPNINRFSSPLLVAINDTTRIFDMGAIYGRDITDIFLEDKTFLGLQVAHTETL